MKRVIGVPGDTVEMRGGDVRVNGRPLAEPYVQRVDPGHDVYDPEFNWQRDYVLGGPGAARSYRPTRDTWGPLTVPAGKYTLWTLPSPTGWKLIINKQNGQWGTEYHSEQDLVRVDAKTETLATPVEQFVIAFEPAAAPSAITFAWDKARYSVSVAKK